MQIRIGALHFDDREASRHEKLQKLEIIFWDQSSMRAYQG